MRKVISLIIGFCFLVNNVSFALSPPVVSGGLGEHTIHNKNIVLAEAALAYELGELNKLKEIVGETDEEKIKEIFEKKKLFQTRRKESLNEKSVFAPAEVTTPYINMVGKVGENIFNVPVSVRKNGKREDYQLLFSTIKKDEESGFPIFFLTDKEFYKLKDSVSSHNKLPYMEEDAAKFVNSVRTRYARQNEDIIDRFIRDIMTKKIKGGDFTEVEGRRKELEWGKKFPDAEAPEKYLSKNFFSYLEKTLDPFLSQLGEGFNLKRALDGKNLCLIKIPHGMKRLEIEEDGEKVPVFGHTSNNVVYLFLDATDYDIVQRTKDTKDWKIKGHKDSTPLFMKDLFKTIVHEIGVAYGARWHKMRSDNSNGHVLLRNKFDFVYDAYLVEPGSSIPKELLGGFEKYLSTGPVNLDELFWKDPIIDEFVLRDHAMGESDIAEFDPAKKFQEKNKKQLAMAIAYVIYGENKDEVQTDETVELAISELKSDHEFFRNINMRFQMYLDAVIAYYLVNGETPLIEELDLEEIKGVETIKNKYTESRNRGVTFSNLIYDSFPEGIDIALRRKVVSIVQKVIRMDESSSVSMSTLRNEVEGGYSSYRLMMKNMLDQIQYRADDIFTYFFGTEEFHIGSVGFRDIMAKSMREIHARETNPYWRTVEEDLASSRDADNTVVIEPDYSKITVNDITPELRCVSDKTGEPDKDFRLCGKNGKELEDYVFDAYAQLNEVSKYDVSFAKWYGALPQKLQEWVLQKYVKISEKEEDTIFLDENESITSALRQIVSDWFLKARDMKIFIEKGQFFASPRTMEISHVRRGLFQDDTGFHVGEYFLREFLGRKVSEDKITEELIIFMLNESMHIGNSIIKHGEIKSLDDFNKKIEHIKIPSVEETREKWVNYVGKKPWEPMADRDASAKRQGIFIGKDPKIIAGLERAKQFVSNDDERVLLVRGAKGDGKSHFAKAVREMMGIKLGDDGETRYYRVPCAELSALDDNKYIRDRFFGKLSEDEQLSSSVLEQLLSDENKKSLLVFDHIEKANDYIFSVLNELLNDPEEISPENKKLKILILADEEATHAAAAKSNLHSLKTGLQNQTVRIPELKSREYFIIEDNEKQNDIVSMAEEFNLYYSKKKGIPWARIEEDMGDILVKWITSNDSKINNVRDLKEIMGRLTQTRKVLQARMKNDKHIGITDIFGKEINLMEYGIDDETAGLINFESLFSPYLMTAIDLLYSGLRIPDVEEAIIELHKKWRKLGNRKSIIWPYFQELAPEGFYYGERFEQPGMTESDPNFFTKYSDSMFIFSSNAVFNDGLRIFLPEMVKNGLKVAVLPMDKNEIGDLELINRAHFGNSDEGIVILKAPKEVKDVQGKFQQYYYFGIKEDKPYDDPNQLLDDFEKIDITDLVTKVKNGTFNGDIMLAVLSNVKKPELVEQDMQGSEQTGQEQNLKYLARMIPKELYAKAMASNPEYLTAIFERFKIYVDVAIAKTVSIGGSELSESHDINADFVNGVCDNLSFFTNGVYDDLDSLRKTAIPQKLNLALCNQACDLVDFFSDIVLERLEGQKGVAFNTFLMGIGKGIKAKATRNGILADAFTYGSKYLTKYQESDLAKLLSKIASSLVEEKDNSYWRTVEEDVGAFRKVDGKITELERWKSGADESISKSTGKDFLRILDEAHIVLESWLARDIQKIEDLPEPLKEWSEKKAREIKEKNPKKDMMDIHRDILLDMKKYIKDALDAKIFMINDEFYVSPRTKEMTHVRRGIKRVDTGIYLGELFIKAYYKWDEEYEDLGKLNAKDFALLLLNEGMHIGKPSAEHKKITSLEDLDKVTEHIKLKYFNKVRRKWEYENFKKPWETYGAVRPNKNIGKCKSIVSAFEELHTFVRFKTQNTLLLEGPSGSGKTKTTEAIEVLMRLKKEAVRTIDCAALSGLRTAELREALYGGGGLIRTLAYKDEKIDNDHKRESALLIIKNLQDADDRMIAQLKAILHDSKKIPMISGEILGMENIKIVCQTEKPLEDLKDPQKTLETLLKENSQYNIRLPELYERGKDVTFLAEFFNFVESKENDLSWAPLDQYAMGLIRTLFGKKLEKSNIKPKTILDLKNFMAKIVKERALLLERINANGHLGNKDLLGKEVREKIGNEEVLLFLKNMFSKCLITCADIAYSSTEVKEYEMEEIIKLANKVRKKAGEEKYLFPYFKEFAPRDPDGNILGFYKGPSPWNQPGMTELNSEDKKNDAKVPSERKNPLWKEIEKNLGSFVDEDRAFEVINETDEIKSVKSGRSMDWPFEKLGHEKFFKTVNEAYEKLDLWVGEDEDVSKNTNYNTRFNALPESVQTWIIKKYCAIMDCNNTVAMFAKDIDVTARLLNYVTYCAAKARKSVLTIAEGTFYVSPTTNTLIHDGRGINQDTSRVWMGEYFLRELGLGAENGMTAEEFAVVLLNAGMHMENLSVRHGEIKAIEEIATIIDHISVSDRYDKAERNWWKYLENPYPWNHISPFEKGGRGDLNEFINGNTRSLLIQGKPGSGLSKFAEDIRTDMQEEKQMETKQILTLSCKDLLGSSYSPDGMRHSFFGGYDLVGVWEPGILEKLVYKEKKTFLPKSLLVIDDFHVLSEALKDDSLRAKTLEILTIFNEILEGLNAEEPFQEINDTIDVSNLKVIFVSNKELTSEISGVLNVDQKITVPELWKWKDNRIVGLAEEFSREESEKAGIPWAPLEKHTAQFIIGHVKENKFQIKDLREFTKAVVAERVEWMRGWEKTGTLPEEIHHDYVNLQSENYDKYFSPYFTSLFFIPSGIITDKQSSGRFCLHFLNMTNWFEKEQTFEPYFKEFAPLDANGEATSYYGGPFRSETDGAIFEQPGMKKTEGTSQSNDQNPALTKAVMDAMNELPRHYREKNGTNHEDVAKVMHEVPYLKNSDVKSVMDYLEELFKGYLFKGEECDVEVERIDKVSGKMKKRNAYANFMKQNFKNPPKNFDKAMFIDVQDPEYWTTSSYDLEVAYNIDYETSAPLAYHIAIAIKKARNTNNVESIHVEMRSNETLELEQEFDISTKMLKNLSSPARIIQETIQENVTSNLIDLKHQEKLPEWIDSAIEENVIDLYRFAKEKGALVFSENVTFKNGVGALLPKLVKAGIKVAVVARTPEQIAAINVLNRTELAKTQKKIVILPDPSEARNTMKNTGHFYYFCVKEDKELDTIPNNDFSVNDITGMVKQIIEALGRASGINVQAEISKLHTAAKKFAQSV